MRAFAIVFLAIASVHAEADADAYTLGQVAAGLTHGGVITGVDYGNGVVSGLGAVGNRPVNHVAYSGFVDPVVRNVATYHHPSTYVTPVNNVYSNVFPNVYSGVHHYIGKREAEAEPEAEPEADPLVYTNNLVHTGVHHAGVFSHVASVPAVSSVHVGVPAVRSYTNSVPAINTVGPIYTTPVNTVYNNVYPNVYSGLHHNVFPNVYSGVHHTIGKREAEAEAEPEADPLVYTNNLVHTGVHHAGVYSHVASVPAVSSVHVGVPAVRSYVNSVPVVPAVNTVASTYTTPVNTVYNNVYPNVYSGLHHNVFPNVYSGVHHTIGKREAEAEAEPEADPFVYTNNLVHTGVHHAGVYNPITYSTVGNVRPVSHVSVGVPAVRSLYNTFPAVGTVNSAVYSGLNPYRYLY